MSRDLYTSMAGAAATWRELETLSSNLANATTQGFKAERHRFVQTGNSDEPLGASYVEFERAEYDLTDGVMSRDNVETHFALQGRGFLLAEDANGQEVLVRGGAFELDADRFLVTPQGDRLLGVGGPIQVPPEMTIAVTPDGVVKTNDGTELAEFRRVTATEIEPLGGTRWRAISDIEDTDEVVVHQGALESSNVNPLSSMTDLITASRLFEAYQKAMQTSDEMDARMYKAGGK